MQTKSADVNESAFNSEVIQASLDKPVLVKFGAKWCGPCKMLKPVLSQLKEEQGDKLGVVEVNVDESRNLNDQYSIMSTPTLILFKNGEEVKRLVGYRSKDFIQSQIQPYF